MDLIASEAAASRVDQRGRTVTGLASRMVVLQTLDGGRAWWRWLVGSGSDPE